MISSPARSYAHYHLIRMPFGVRLNLDFGEYLDGIHTLEKAVRERIWLNVMEPDHSHFATFCHDEDCDKTKRPE